MRKTKYSIVIPIHNEENVLSKLIKNLKDFYKKGHEIIIVNDGSTDDSNRILTNYKFLKTISIKNNSGKGSALKLGIAQSKNDKIIVFDGDLELSPKEISRLMILDKNQNIRSVFGSRFKKISPFISLWNFGNYCLTILFNLRHNTNHSDALCCAVAFYKSDIKIKDIKSNYFDIDVELKTILSKKPYESVILSYNRRNFKEGKKLRLIDSVSIIKRILNF